MNGAGVRSCTTSAGLMQFFNIVVNSTDSRNNCVMARVI